jgi:hypothetical protein
MLKWVFGADTKPFQQGLSSMRGQVEGFSKSAGAMMLKAFGFAALIGGARAFFTEMDRIAKLAKRLGESTDSVQRVGAVADLDGANLETIAKALTLVTRNSATAAQGNKAMAESFARLNINAVKFADLPMEEKLVELSRGYVSSRSSAQGLNDIMKVLGKSGAEIIPLLAQGPQSLADAMAAVNVVSGSAIKSIEYFNDSLTKLGQTSKSWSGQFIQSWQLAVATGTTNAMKMIAVMSTLKDYLTTDMSFDEIGGKISDRFKVLNEGLMRTGADILGMGSKTGNKPTGGIVDTSADDARAKLANDIAKLEEESRNRQLSLAERILKTQQRIADLANQSSYGDTEEERLEATKARLEAEAELAGLTKEQAAEAKRADEEKQRINDQATDRAIAAREAEAEIDREMAMEKMSDAEKIALLEKEQKSLMADARLMDEQGDPAGAAESRVKAKRKQQEIDRIKAGMEKPAATPTIIAEDIKRAGGGGFANFGAKIDPQKEAVNELKSIRASLASIDAKTRGAGPPPPSDL